MKRPSLKLVAIILLILLIGIQLIPVWLLETNPAITAEPNWDSPQTQALAKRACYDCHSNETSWPLYARIAPFSWLVTFDVVRARREMNFSEWTGRQARPEKAREAANEIASGDMPPYYYLWLHPGARLNAAEKQQLSAGLQKSLQTTK